MASYSFIHWKTKTRFRSLIKTNLSLRCDEYKNNKSLVNKLTNYFDCLFLFGREMKSKRNKIWNHPFVSIAILKWQLPLQWQLPPLDNNKKRANKRETRLKIFPPIILMDMNRNKLQKKVFFSLFPITHIRAVMITIIFRLKSSITRHTWSERMTSGNHCLHFQVSFFLLFSLRTLNRRLFRPLFFYRCARAPACLTAKTFARD